MYFGKEGNLIAYRLKDGEEVIESLKLVAGKYGVKSGMILCGIGMIRDFEISFYSREEGRYMTTKFDEPVELLSLTGNISSRNNEASLHLHAALAKEDKNAIGGHLDKATVHNTIEGAIVKFSEIKLTRDAETRILHIS